MADENLPIGALGGGAALNREPLSRRGFGVYQPSPLAQMRPQWSPEDLAAHKAGLEYMTSGEAARVRGTQQLEAAHGVEQQRLQQAYDFLSAQKPDYTALMAQMAGNFFKPTRTGGFGESLGNAMEGAAPHLSAVQGDAEKRRLGMLKLQLGMGQSSRDLYTSQIGAAGERSKLGHTMVSDALKRRRDDLAAQRAEAREAAVENRFIRALTAKNEQGSGPESPAGKQAADEGLTPGTPAFWDRVAEIGRLDVPGSLEKKQRELELQRESEMIERRPKIEATLEQLRRKQAIVNTTVDDAIAAANNWSTGWGAKLFGSLPETEALQMQGLLDTIKANVGFDELTEMRANSPTGGALGNVSEKENVLLQALKGSLNPLLDAPTMKKNLGTIKRLYAEVLEEREAAFAKDYAKQLKERDGTSPSALPDGVTEEDIVTTMQETGMTRDEVLEKLRVRGRK